jgi:hypothetical protein
VTTTATPPETYTTQVASASWPNKRSKKGRADSCWT